MDFRIPSLEEIADVKEGLPAQLDAYADKLFVAERCILCGTKLLIIDAYVRVRGQQTTTHESLRYRPAPEGRTARCLYHPGTCDPRTGIYSCCNSHSIPGCSYGRHAFASLGHSPRVLPFPSKIISRLPLLPPSTEIVRTKAEIGTGSTYEQMQTKAYYEALETAIFGEPSDLHATPIILGSQEMDMSYSFYQSSIYVRGIAGRGPLLVTDDTLPVEMHIYRN